LASFYQSTFGFANNVITLVSGAAAATVWWIFVEGDLLIYQEAIGFKWYAFDNRVLDESRLDN